MFEQLILSIVAVAVLLLFYLVFLLRRDVKKVIKYFDATGRLLMKLDERQKRLKEESINMEKSVKQSSAIIRNFSDSTQKIINFIEDTKSSRAESTKMSEKVLENLEKNEESFRELGDLLRITCSIAQGFGGTVVPPPKQDDRRGGNNKPKPKPQRKPR